MKNIIAVKTNAYKGFSAKETFEGIAKAGYKYVELSATPNSNTNISRFVDFTSLCQSKDTLNKLGLIPISLGGHTDIMDEELIPDFINNIRLAHFFGCKYIVTSVGDPHKNEDKIVADEIVASHIMTFLPYLEQYDITMVIELHGKHDSGYKLANICKLVGSDRVKINYDTGNVIFYGGVNNQGLLKDIEDNIDYIGYMHIKDKAQLDNKWDFPAVGKGKIDFVSILKLLEKHQNNCPLVVEVEFTPAGIKDAKEADKAILDSKKYLESLDLFGE